MRTKLGGHIPPLKPDDEAVGMRCWNCEGKFGPGSLIITVHVMAYDPFAVHLGCVKATIARLEGIPYEYEEGTDMADYEEEDEA